jgi:hypothetical protein
MKEILHEIQESFRKTEITEEMYRLAKVVIDEYEGKNNIDRIYERMEKTFDKDNYNNPFEVGEIMPCCGERYCFSYATMKYMPRNPKLKYREHKYNEGDVDFDYKSENPGFVQYNNCREAIRQAKAKGLDHVHWRLSVACAEAIRKDGYIDHNDKLNTISWGRNFEIGEGLHGRAFVQKKKFSLFSLFRK